MLRIATYGIYTKTSLSHFAGVRLLCRLIQCRRECAQLIGLGVPLNAWSLEVTVIYLAVSLLRERDQRGSTPTLTS